MPRLKKDIVFANVAPDHAEARTEAVEVEFHVNSDGEFYCTVPDPLLPVFAGDGLQKFSHKGVRVSNNRAGKLALYARVLDDLYSVIQGLMCQAWQPKVTEKVVILYNIESHVSFALDENDNIARNAVGNARWAEPNAHSDSRYGNHHSNNAAKGGYSLTIGARVVVETTIEYGDSKEVSRRMYRPEREYDEDGTMHPAAKLNSWCSFSLPDPCKSMPYSDEAALFFDNLMYGMATLSRMVQERTFEEDDLMALIQGNQTLLPGPRER